MESEATRAKLVPKPISPFLDYQVRPGYVSVPVTTRKLMGLRDRAVVRLRILDRSEVRPVCPSVLRLQPIRWTHLDREVAADVRKSRGNEATSEVSGDSKHHKLSDLAVTSTNSQSLVREALASIVSERCRDVHELEPLILSHGALLSLRIPSNFPIRSATDGKSNSADEVQNVPKIFSSLENVEMLTADFLLEVYDRERYTILHEFVCY